jgi:two-component system KDP operon response regulator KdpE
MAAQADAAVAGGSTTREAPAVGGPLVLVVDDEAPTQTMLRIVLNTSGLRTVEARSGAEALARAAGFNPDLVLLDMGLPDSNGLEVTRRLRDWMVAPILIISARGDERDKVAVLDAGADDYLTKPIANGELLARIRVWIRRAAPDAPEDAVIEVGDLRLDLAQHLVSRAGRELRLTPTEYRLFATLMRNRGRVMTHRQLLEATWGRAHAEQTQYLRVYMGQLRRKLEEDSTRPRYLLTEPGVGYRVRV